jgi:hypothetical protein
MLENGKKRTLFSQHSKHSNEGKGTVYGLEFKIMQPEQCKKIIYVLIRHRISNSDVWFYTFHPVKFSPLNVVSMCPNCLTILFLINYGIFSGKIGVCNFSIPHQKEREKKD